MCVCARARALKAVCAPCVRLLHVVLQLGTAAKACCPPHHGPAGEESHPRHVTSVPAGIVYSSEWGGQGDIIVRGDKRGT